MFGAKIDRAKVETALTTKTQRRTQRTQIFFGFPVSPFLMLFVWQLFDLLYQRLHGQNRGGKLPHQDRRQNRMEIDRPQKE
jgi:hypothetical protein